MCFFSRIQLFPWSILRFFRGVAGGTKPSNGQRSWPIVSSCDRTTTKIPGGKAWRKVGEPCPSSTMSTVCHHVQNPYEVDEIPVVRMTHMLFEVVSSVFSCSTLLGEDDAI